MLLFPNLQEYQEPLISDFLAKIPSTFTQAHDRLLKEFGHRICNPAFSENVVTRYNTKYGQFTFNDRFFSEEYVLNNRMRMIQPIQEFHRNANTMNRAVNSSISDLSDPSTIILVATHQPNLFSYGGIFKKIVLLQALKDIMLESNDSLKIINLFVIIDHDFADENWIRVAQLPNVRSANGIMQLRLHIDKSMRWRMVCNMPRPSKAILDHWRGQLISWIRKSSLFQDYVHTLSHLNDRNSKDLEEKAREAIISNLNSFWDIVEDCYSKASTYSDFNAFIMSKIVNDLWEYDTLFVRLTELANTFERGYGNLLRNYDVYRGILSETERLFLKSGIPSGVSSTSYLQSPLWLHCNCGSKSATKIASRDIRDRTYEFVLEGKCMGCKKHLRVELLVDEGGQVKNNHNQLKTELSPRSIPIVLLLSSELGMSCYVSGTDGMRYVLFGRSLFEQFSPKNIPLFMAWPARDNYYGFAQSEALRMVQLRNKDELQKYIGRLKEDEEGYKSLIQPVLDKRRGASTGPNQSQSEKDKILSVLFSLKRDQRNIRAKHKLACKAENALNLRPCIIDYAINFGLRDTESQWRRNLLYNQDLNSPNNLFCQFDF